MRRASLLLLALALAACGRDNLLLGPEGVIAGGNGTRPGGITTDVVGTWRFAIFFTDDVGIPRSSETTWQFSSDGAAIRTVVARNFAVGLADATVATGRWTVEGSELVIEFLPPQSGTARLPFRRDGETLVLSGAPFVRVGG